MLINEGDRLSELRTRRDRRRRDDLGEHRSSVRRVSRQLGTVQVLGLPSRLH